MQAIVAREGGNFEVAPWDWRYFAEKRRKAEFDFDEGEIKPYLQLDRLIEAAFYAATRLFGLSFAERFDLKLYHSDARAWTVTGRSGAPVALFIGDYFARPSKRSGAWMSEFRGQQKLDGTQLPIVVNVMNFAKGGEGEPSLLSFNDSRTLFHEFGHALHDMLSDVTYPLIAGIAPSPPVFSQRGIEHLSRPEIEALLDLSDEAVAISRQVEKKRATLCGRTQINLFFEASTRTKSSFELAGKRLGADVMNMAVGASSVRKGRDADRHRHDPQRNAARHSGRAPLCGRRGVAAGAQSRLLGRQRRRRRARAPDPGAARRADHFSSTGLRR